MRAAASAGWVPPPRRRRADAPPSRTLEEFRRRLNLPVSVRAETVDIEWLAKHSRSVDALVLELDSLGSEQKRNAHRADQARRAPAEQRPRAARPR